MVGFHCKMKIGEAIESTQFFLLFEVPWLVMIGWMKASTECLRGGLI